MSPLYDFDNRDSATLYRIAKQIIPGGTQLLSKRPELHAPDVWPAYYQRATGCEIVDLDGRILLDMSTNGVGSCLLGYADPDVTQAVTQRIAGGSMCSLNSPDEVRLAQQLLSIHNWADQVRYARTGGEAMAIAIRIARGPRDATGLRSAAIMAGVIGISPPIFPPLTRWRITCWRDWNPTVCLGP